jgi:hypothetical protein
MLVVYADPLDPGLAYAEPSPDDDVERHALEWPGGLFELPDGSRLDLPAGTLIRRSGGHLSMRLPDGAYLEVEPPRFEDSTYEVNAWSPAAERDDHGVAPRSYYLTRATPERAAAWGPPQSNSDAMITVILDEPADAWVPPELYAPVAWEDVGGA